MEKEDYTDIDKLRGLADFLNHNKTDSREERKLLYEVIKSLEKSNWVSVADRLPKDFGIYTVCLLNDGIFQIHFENLSCDGRWFSLPPYELHEDNPVTHWKELPKPPKR